MPARCAPHLPENHIYGGKTCYCAEGSLANQREIGSRTRSERKKLKENTDELVSKSETYLRQLLGGMPFDDGSR